VRISTRIFIFVAAFAAMASMGVGSASAAFTWEGTWNVPEFQATWNVTGSDTEFRYEEVTSPGTDWANTYSINATRTTVAPMVFVGTLYNSGYPGKPESAFAGTVEFTVNIDGTSFAGTIKYSNGMPNDTINGTCTAGACAKNTPVWPPLPSPLVTLESVANGCGPGTAGTKPRYFDTAKYTDKTSRVTYTVTFRKACDVHDAAYNGARIKDPFNDDKMVDFYRIGQYRIDQRFLDDMRTLCFQQIPGHAVNARYQCTHRGATFSTGALDRYDAVNAVGHHSFVKRPTLQGTWIARDGLGRPKPAWQMRQSNRILLASWNKPNNTGSFRGMVISRDGMSFISGFAITKVNGVTKAGVAMFVWNPKTPNRMRVTGALSGLVLTR
jgi:hypothetical protein